MTMTTSHPEFEQYIRSGITPENIPLWEHGVEVTSDAIERALAQASPMRQVCKVQIGGAELGFPSGELYAMPAATQSLLDDGVADVDQWLADEVKDVFAAQESAAFIDGDGVNKPLGVLRYNAQISTGQERIAQTSGMIGVDFLIGLIHTVKPTYRARGSFICNRRTICELRKIKDSNGYYIWEPAREAGGFSRLLGYPVVEMEDTPDLGSNRPNIIFGDLARGYKIVDRQGVRILRDPYSAKPYVLFYTTKQVGGGVRDPEALVLGSMRL